MSEWEAVWPARQEGVGPGAEEEIELRPKKGQERLEEM
jgi:hypothetical protein